MNWTKEMGLWAVKRMQKRASTRKFRDKSIKKELLDELLGYALLPFNNE